MIVNSVNTYIESSEIIDKLLKFNVRNEIFFSLVLMLILILFSLVIFFTFKHAMKDPLKKPKGLVFLGVWFFNVIQNFVTSTMGEKNRNFSGYMFGLVLYVFFGFSFGLTGLSSPFTYIVMPLSVTAWTFILIHATAVKTNKWGYFRRYIDPFPVFLPINLITMWAPLLSLTLRMFGNALSGFCIMALFYGALEALSADIFRPIFGMATGGGIQGPDIILAPLITPIFHVYFDLISSAIQTLVFSMLTMIFIAQEQNDEDEDKIIDKISAEQIQKEA